MGIESRLVSILHNRRFLPTSLFLDDGLVTAFGLVGMDRFFVTTYNIPDKYDIAQ